MEELNRIRTLSLNGIKKWSKSHVSRVASNLLRLRYGEYAVPSSLWDSIPEGRVDSNHTIASAIDAGHPYCVARIGNDEFETLQRRRRATHTGVPRGLLEAVATGDPFFSLIRSRVRVEKNGLKPLSVPTLKKFYALMTDSFTEVNLLGSWLKGENYYSNFFSDAQFCRRSELEPYRSKTPWTQALEGKKVLLVHPFVETIRQQYVEQRAKIFPGTNILPKFELLNFCPPRAHFGEVKGADHWFHLLEEMIQSTSSLEFDVAIIGAGPFGLPLAAALKRRNRVAIHLGGATQLLFGISGKRWDTDDTIRCLSNSSWVRPSQDETPARRQQRRSPYW